MASYASKTTVTVERSRAELESTLSRYGATSFLYGWDADGAMIAFVVETEGQQRQVRFHLPLPRKDNIEFTHHSRGRRTPAAAEAEWEQACRQRWRALNLVVKAKLEAVQSGIATFEQEFLSYIALPSGQTVGNWIKPQLDDAYSKGVMPSAIRLELGS